MQTPPIPLADISALLAKAEADPGSLTPDEVDRITAVAGALGPALERFASEIAAAVQPVMASLAEALLAVLPYLERYSAERDAALAALPTEGWWFPGSARKAHYFVGGRSLCSHYLTIGQVSLDPDAHRSPDDCSQCRRKLDARGTLHPGGLS